MNPMVPGEGGRMVEAFATLRTSVWLFIAQHALFEDRGV